MRKETAVHNNASQIKENKMGIQPINSLLVSMSLPMMISMLVQALYNIVDSIYVARIEEKALTAVSLAFPVQNIMIAMAMGTCVGMNALLSRHLGEKEFEKADSVAKTTMFLAVCHYLIFLLLGCFFVRPFYYGQTTDQTIIRYGIEYLRIICTCSFGIFLQAVFERILQSTGKTFYTMITQGTGALINIVLDPILIFGYFGFPAMGVKGAAVATVFGQCVAAVLAVCFNLAVNHEVNLGLKGFKPRLAVIRQIYFIGIPSIIMQAISGIMNFGMNQILMTFSDTATAVFGVYYKLQSFIFMPVFGLNNGMVPIIAYNFGAGSRSRVVKTIKLGVMYSVCIMLLGVLIMQCLPEKLLLLFEASDTMLSIGTPALRIISIHFALAGFCIVMSTAFQSLGYAWCSMINSICRQVVVILPAAWLLSLSGRLELIWWSFPIAEFVSAALQVSFLVLVCKKVIMHIGEDQEN
jgi:putative MATE family efflux protein